MEKRFIIFVILSFVILIGWQFALSKFYPEAPTPPPDQQQQQQPAQSAQSPQSPQPAQPAAGETAATPAPATPTEGSAAPRQIVVETPLYRATFDNRGAVLTSMSIKRLPNGRELKSGKYGPLEMVSQEGLKRVGAPLRLNAVQNADLNKKLNESYYQVEAAGDTIQLNDGEQKDLVFTYKDSAGVQVQKRLRFYGGQYLFDISVDALANGQPLPVNMFIGPNFGDQDARIDAYAGTPPQAVVEHDNAKVEFVAGTDLEHRSSPPDREKVINNDINLIASADHYFAMAVVPPAPLPKATIHNNFYEEKVEDDKVYRHLLSTEFPIVNNQAYQVFTGPKDHNVLKNVNDKLGGRADLVDLINYGIFSFFIRPVMAPVLDLVLKGFNKLTHNYGWAIVLMTILINMAFFPLKWKSSVAMKKAMKLQPKMKEIQEQMKKLKKDDPRMQQLQTEQMKLMKEGNPLAGCLPLFMQMPIFWGIYVYLTISLDMRHAPFMLWVKDLSGPDNTWILPILMTISMMGATALTPTPTDPAQKMQKYMTAYIMPIIFLLLFFAKAPSGLVLYWMFGNIVGLIQQLVINKLTTEPGEPNAPATGTDTKPDTKGKKKTDKSTTTGDLANVR